MGIPPKYAPDLAMHWHSRSVQFADKERRAELKALAQARLDALVDAAKVAIAHQALDVAEKLIVGGFDSQEARAFVESLPTVEALMPPLSLDDLGVRRWRPDEDAAAQLVTPSTPAQRKRRQILKAIAAHPGLSNRRIAEIAGVDHKTVASYRDGFDEDEDDDE